MSTREYRWRHLTLLLSILLLFIVSPLVVELRHGVLILNIVGATVLLAASYAISERKRLFHVAVILSAISIIATSLLLAYPKTWAVLISHASIVVLVAFFIVTILDAVLRAGRITADRIFAAICVYMLIGYAWTFAYAILEELKPGSFTVPPETVRNDYVGRVMQLRYFSFVTLATVGYGDIVPRAPAARTMAMLEAITGQFYLVALIGRLVGLHIVHTTRSASRDKE